MFAFKDFIRQQKLADVRNKNPMI